MLADLDWPQHLLSFTQEKGENKVHRRKLCSWQVNCRTNGYNYGGHYCRRHKGLESGGMEVWEGITGVMTLEESGSRMSIGVVSWDWRRIQSFVVDNEMKFRVWICKWSASVSFTGYRAIFPWKNTSIRLTMYTVAVQCISPLPVYWPYSTAIHKPQWNSWELSVLVTCCSAPCPRHGCKCG